MQRSGRQARSWHTGSFMSFVYCLSRHGLFACMVNGCDTSNHVRRNPSNGEAAIRSWMTCEACLERQSVFEDCIDNTEVIYDESNPYTVGVLPTPKAPMLPHVAREIMLRCMYTYVRMETGMLTGISRH